MATYSDILRAKKEAEGLRSKSERFRGLAESAGPVVTGGGMVQGMAGAVSPAPATINYGDIIQRGIGNFQAGQADKQADAKEMQAEEFNQQFMQESLGSDPEAQRLMQMAQAGIPGAEQALSERIAPKKEALGAFLQHLQSGVADPAMVAELAPRYGLSPEIATKAAETALSRQAQAEQLKHQQALELAAARRAGMVGGRTGGRSGSGTGAGGGDTEISLTPGEKMYRSKALMESQEKLRSGAANVSRGESMRDFMYDDKTFGIQQKLAQVLAQSDVPVLGGALAAVGQGMRSEGAAKLEAYVNSEVLDKMAALGGNDSNEELRQMRLTLPSVLNNPTAARGLYEDLLAWQKRKLQEERDYQSRLQSGQFFETTPRVQGGPGLPVDTSPMVPPGAGGPQQPAPPGSAAPQPQQVPAVPPMLAPMAPQAPASRGKIKILSIE